jgi:hypothetical protein
MSMLTTPRRLRARGLFIAGALLATTAILATDASAGATTYYACVKKNGALASIGTSESGAAAPVQRCSEANISLARNRRVGCCIHASTITGTGSQKRRPDRWAPMRAFRPRRPHARAPYGARWMIALRGSFWRGRPMPAHRRTQGSYTGRKPSSCGIVTRR